MDSDNNGATLVNDYYAGSLDKLVDLYYFFRNNGFTVFGLNRVNGIVKYDIVSSIDNLLNYINKPCDKLPSSSIKNILHPPNQLMYIISRDFNIKHSIVDGEIVFFPIKSCDLHALSILDKLLDKDPHYVKRRSRVKYIVVEECVVNLENCFCGSTETGPIVYENYDLAYVVIDNKVVFKTGSIRGYELVKYLNLVEAPGDLVDKYRELVWETASLTRRFNSNNLSRILEREIENNKFWIEASSKCIGCGNCNTVCPTCFCNEFRDVIVDNEVYRYRHWICCLTHMYGLTAGLHYRPELYMRFRHFILHKFLFKQMRIGRAGCTGCGRCITWCPMGIDFREIYRELLRNV